MQTTDITAKLKAEYERLGYAFFEGDEFDLNIFGLRHPDMGNAFNDLLGCAYKSNGEWQLRLWKATTDPGRYYLQNPMNSGGTAVMKPGQYRGLWQLGLHRSSYQALVQTGNEVTVWRDADGDASLDFDESKLSTGYFGINHHKSGTHSEAVDKWSAGCQVHKDQASFEEAMHLARMQALFHPTWTKYTYTLFTLMDEPGCQKSNDLAFLFDLTPAWYTHQERRRAHGSQR
jgi:hypothetical protein